MRGHILLHKLTRKGIVYVPEASIQFEATSGDRKGWIKMFRTDGRRWDLELWQPGELSIEWLANTFDFVREVEVPETMLRWVNFEKEKQNRRSEAFGMMFERMFRPLEEGKEPINPMENPATAKAAVHGVVGIMDAPMLGEIDEIEKYEMALQIQRWIYESGGLA